MAHNQTQLGAIRPQPGGGQRNPGAPGRKGSFMAVRFSSPDQPLPPRPPDTGCAHGSVPAERGMVIFRSPGAAGFTCQAGSQPSVGLASARAIRYGLNNITPRMSDCTESMPQHPGRNAGAACGLRPQH